MSDKTTYLTLKIVSSLVLLLLGAALWYYTIGRKPRVLISAPIKGNASTTTVRSLGGNEVLLLVGSKVTLYDLAKKKERWSANLTVSAAPAPKPIAAKAATPKPTAPKPIAKPTATPDPALTADPLLVARVKKRFAKLEKWAAELSVKRGKLKTPLQIEAFNEEALKYHAALTEARAEAAPLQPLRPIVAQEAAPQHEVGEDVAEFFMPERTEIVTLAGTVWIAQNRRVTGLNLTDGKVVKSLPVLGNISSIWAGAGELFVMVSMDHGHDVQVIRLAADSTPNQQFVLTLPPEPRAEEWHQGVPHTPTTPDHRIVFDANGGSLLQLDIRLVEKKLTERQSMPGKAGSDLEAADKKTKGGVGDDALAFAEALSKEAERESTGGREIIDESTYALTLRRPFTPAVAAGAAEVHGHAELFSTPSLDLVVAGKELLAFDRSNKKLWQAQLTQPIAPVNRFEEDAQPFLESGDRLYFFDTAYLTAFQRETGQPLWRLPLKGIHKVQLDESGHLYLATQPSGFGELPQLLQLEAKTGRVLWKLEKYQDCFVSGKDLYVTRETQNGDDAVNRVFDPNKAPQCRWKLYKLNTRNGESQWEWFQTRRPSRIEVDHKRVALLFSDELQMLTSLAL